MGSLAGQLLEERLGRRTYENHYVELEDLKGGEYGDDVG